MVVGQSFRHGPIWIRVFVALAAPLKPPFAKRGRGITRGLQDRAQRVGVRQQLVELVIADIRVPLRQTRQKRGPRRSTDRRRTIMLRQHHPITRQRIDLRGREMRLSPIAGRCALVLPEYANISESQIIA